MSSRQPRPDLGCATRGSGGFTLVELLLALTLAALVTSAVYRFTSFTGRFIAQQAAREEVQQNIRASLELIASDLRAALPEGVLKMDSDSVRFFLPRLWGISCMAVDPDTETLWAVFPAGVLPPDPFFGRAHWGVALQQQADSAAVGGGWRFVLSPSRRWDGDPCSLVQPRLEPEKHATYGFTRPEGISFAPSGAVPPGATVVVFEEIKYDVAASGAGVIRGSWLRRMMGRSGTIANMQPMAGPMAARDGLRFRYFAADGSPANVPRDVRRVEVRVIGVSRQESGSGAARTPLHVDTATIEVLLRNAD